jgi:glucosylceramidase
MGGFTGRRLRPTWLGSRRGIGVALAFTCLAVTVACKPASSAPPEIIGVPEVGQTLTASPGTWSGGPAFSYTWHSCTGGVPDECLARQEGPAAAYVVVAADLGRRIRVQVTATNTDGTQTVASALTAVVTEGSEPPIPWQSWATSPDQARVLTAVDRAQEASADRALALTAGVLVQEPSTAELVIDRTVRHQTWLGVGGAVTDSSVSLIERAGSGLTSALFDPAAPNGARLNLLRLPLSATDFSTRFWTWQDNPAQAAVPPDEAQRALAVVDRAVALRPDLRLVAAAWSAPAAMKDSGTLQGGGLAPGKEDAYAGLLLHQAALLQASGYPLMAMTLGNEPGNSNPTYPTMTMTDQQMIGLAQSLHGSLALQGVELWALDHNWDDRGRVDTLLAGAPGAFAAAAFHCYGGKPEGMAGLPVPAAMTECTGGDWDSSWASTFRWQARNLVTDAAAYGSTGLLLFNLALDPTRGPHTGGCGNCRGIVTVDPATGTWTPEPEYYLLAHLSRAADRGATRVDLTSRPDIPAVAFENPDGTIGIFGHNDSGVRQVVSVRFPAGDAARIAVEPGELFTLRGPAVEGAPAPSALCQGRPCFDAVAARGHIIRNSDGTSYYVDKTGWRHWIRDGGVFNCLGGWDNVIDGVDWDDIRKIPEAEHAECFTAVAGDIIRHPDGDSYLLTAAPHGLLRHHLPTAAAYACTRAEGNRQVVSVTRYQVEEIALGTPQSGANCIVRAPEGDAHFINNEGRREWIPDSITWDCEIGREVRVVDTSRTVINSIDEVGWHYCLNKASLRNEILTHADGDSHFIHADDTSTWIPDKPTYDCRIRQGRPVNQTRWREYVTAFTETGWDYCFDPALFRNRVLTHADGDSHFIHPDDTRTWIPDTFTYACRINQGQAVVQTRWREYVTNFRETGWDYCYDINTMKGRIITHPDGDSHYVGTDGRRHWIPSQAVYNCLRSRGIPADVVRWREYITATPEGEWAVCGDTMTTGQKLDRGQWLRSADGRYTLRMQTDGNLVLYNAAGAAVWATNRTGQYVIVQPDGNLVEYNSAGTAVWFTGTVGSGANRLVMQSDGNLVLYAPGGPVWWTGTVGR